MKKSYAIIFMLLMLVLILPVFGCKSDENNPENPEDEPGTLYIFDLKTFLKTMTSSVAEYDYFKLATALQGMANRDKAQIYFMYESTSFNNQQGFDIDKFWLDELSGEGKYLFDFVKDYDTYKPTLEGFYKLMADFSDYYDGFVLWDHDVPATANVASTAAGAQNLLPVRYYPDEAQSLYNDLFLGEARYSLSDIKLDLAGKFTGEPGNIWDTDILSTGSAKNDAYLWAKAKYLDAGLTNPLRMAYCTDSWVKQEEEQIRTAEFAELPDFVMAPGETVTLRCPITNNTDEIWQEAASGGPYRLGSIEGNEFRISRQKPSGYEDNGNYRIFIAGEVAPGDTYVFEFDITAPNEVGTATLALQMVQDGVRWIAPVYTVVVEIAESADTGENSPKKSTAPINYPVMFWTTLANADFHIAQKAFFWDLSPDETVAPIDDRGQKLGEDVRTLNAILWAQAKQSGFDIFNVSGFVPWNFKYTTAVDRLTKMEPVQSEWTMINRISSYGGQTEADANAGVGDASNLSVMSHVPLNQEFKQKNDKGKSNTLSFDPDTHYVMIYMGDYDSAVWTSSILSMIWANSKDDRGKYPLCWPIPTGISERIPQLFNYLYENATQNDFFVAGDNGTAYLNASMFEPELRPEGMPDLLATWEKYNTEKNKRFDIDVLGLHINMDRSTLSNETLSRRLMESMSRSHPVGVSAQMEKYYEIPTLVENPANGAATPFINYWDIGGAGSSAQVIATNIYNVINSKTGNQRNQNFHNLRCILIPPSVINEAIDLLKSGAVGDPENLKFEIVDPYTCYRLAQTQKTK